MKKIMAVVLILAVVLGLVGCSAKDKAIGKVVGDYDTSNLAGSFLTSENEAYLIGANSQGLPIFRNPDLAWDAMIIDYADGLKAIQNSFDLAEIAKKDFEFYKVYGVQVDDNYAVEIIEQCKDISRFLDIYENSFV